jgi:hypothetical protein
MKPSLSPAEIVPLMIEEVLTLAESWLAWNGEVVERDGREMTPLKAIRRVTDHVIDHLAEIQSRCTGHAPLPDNWHHSTYTTNADRAPFGPADLNEARERLLRLSQLWRITVEPIPPEMLDAAFPGQMTLRELAAHTAGSKVYANVLGVIDHA